MAWVLMNSDCSMAWRWSGKTYMGRVEGGLGDREGVGVACDN